MRTLNVSITEQQQNILRYLVRGRSNEQISDILELSEKEVANYRKSLMKSAGVKNNEDLIVWIKENYNS
ncbi:MAG: helix-turn-helix transcriptional regulator [Cytophagales bacterium]